MRIYTFTEGLDLDEGIDLAVRSIRAAQNRDAATGGGIALSVITPAGYKEFSDEEVHKRFERQ
jgi:proteasome beta subunit